MDPEVPGSSPGGGTTPKHGDAGAFGFSAHARYAAHTAKKLGLAFTALEPDGYLFEISDGARRAVFSAGAGTPYALNAAHAAAIARDKAFAQTVLARAGLATIPSRLYFVTAEHRALRGPGREPEDAIAYAASAQFPLFCKPIDGAQGAFAEIIADRAQFERYLRRVGAKHYAILIQPVIEAREHRVFVLRDHALFCYEKWRALVVGDGRSSLAALAGAGAETVQAHDDEGRRYGAEDVAPTGRTLALDGARNRALGGDAGPISTQVEPGLARLARAAAAALRLKLAAVDVFETESGLIIVEVNSNPAIKTLEAQDRWDLIERIWTANIEAALALAP